MCVCVYIYSFDKEYIDRDFPGGTEAKNTPANARETGSRPGLGRSHMLLSN